LQRAIQSQPGVDTKHHKVQRLNVLFAERPLSIIKAIANGQVDRLRGFSDAFKLRD
jgi:hypothetical protein